MEMDQLEKKLQDLKQQYKTFFAPGYRLEGRERLNVLHEEILTTERHLAELRQEEFALPWKLPIEWSFSEFPTPLVVSQGWRTFLIYPALPDLTGRAAQSDREEVFAVLEFGKCASSKIGDPNDEIIEGHPLFGKGIDVGESYLVENSKWLAELKKTNQVHSQYDSARWHNIKHFLIFFKEHTFECLAENVVWEVIPGDLTNVLKSVFQRITA